VSAVETARWSWTAEAYETAAVSGVFGPDPRVELVDGEVYQLAPMLPLHASAVRELRHRFTALDEGSFTVDSQTPIRLDERSEPEPDVWVARGPRAGYRDRHPDPADLVLVVEVSGSSLAYDREVKVPAYASAGVVEVWVVSLPERIVYRHVEPSNGRYSLTTAVSDGSLAVAGVEVRVGDLFAT
jgi:Uma2 family endonuclease